VFSVACIIPVTGNTEGLETTLLSVLERRTDTCEVLVVLNTPYNDPYHLQGEIQILQAPAGTGLIDCINLGISASRAPIVHLLATGCEASHNWMEHALAHFDDPRVAAVTPVIYDRQDHERLLAAGVGYDRGGRRIICRSTRAANDSLSTTLGPLLQAAFYRKSALRAFGGGLPVAVGDELADIDLALSLRCAGWQLLLEPDCKIFASSMTELQPKGFSSGLWSERFYWRHITQTGGLRGLFLHSLVALQDLIRSRPWWNAPAQATGRLIAVCQLGHYSKYKLSLVAALRDAAAAEAQWQTGQKVSNIQSSVPRVQHRTDAPHRSVQPSERNKQRHSHRRR